MRAVRIVQIVVFSIALGGLQGCSANVNPSSDQAAGDDSGLSSGQNARGTESNKLAQVGPAHPQGSETGKEAKNDKVEVRGDASGAGEATKIDHKPEDPKGGVTAKGDPSNSDGPESFKGDSETALQPFVIAGSALGDNSDPQAIYSFVNLDEGSIRVLCNDYTVYKNDANSSGLIQCWLANWPDNLEEFNPSPYMADPSRTSWQMRVSSCPEATLKGTYGIHTSSLESILDPLGMLGSNQAAKNPATQVVINGDLAKTCVARRAILSFTLTDKISLNSRIYTAEMTEFIYPDMTTPMEESDTTVEPMVSLEPSAL